MSSDTYLWWSLIATATTLALAGFAVAVGVATPLSGIVALVGGLTILALSVNGLLKDR